MENFDYTLLTLGQLLSYKDQNIRRQAMGIFKALPEANARIDKAYIEDAMTRANKYDHAIRTLGQQFSYDAELTPKEKL
jgi:hypothetical protein